MFVKFYFLVLWNENFTVLKFKWAPLNSCELKVQLQEQKIKQFTWTKNKGCEIGTKVIKVTHAVKYIKTISPVDIGTGGKYIFKKNDFKSPIKF